VGAGGADYELRSTLELVERMNDEDALVAAAVRTASVEIAAVVDAVVDRLRDGGRLIYVGAGSSGRLGALDAAECESTFSAAPGQVLALVAGSELESTAEQEAAEDDVEAGAEAVTALGVTAADAVVGISASGRTPYVLGAMAAAAAAGAVTACVVSVRDSELSDVVEHEVVVLVGPEFLAGSTRLKSGTAQKLVLNMLSTISMIRLGKTFGNLMVDVSRRTRSCARGSRGSSARDGCAEGRRRRRARRRARERASRDRLASRRGRRGDRACPAPRGEATASAGRSSETRGRGGGRRQAGRPGDVEVADGRIAGYGLPSANGRGSRFPDSSTCR
jgi:N-acetylmuramic acid 6-phosphate etherase